MDSSPFVDLDPKSIRLLFGVADATRHHYPDASRQPPNPFAARRAGGLRRGAGHGVTTHRLRAVCVCRTVRVVRDEDFLRGDLRALRPSRHISLLALRPLPFCAATRLGVGGGRLRRTGLDRCRPFLLHGESLLLRAPAPPLSRSRNGPPCLRVRVRAHHHSAGTIVFRPAHSPNLAAYALYRCVPAADDSATEFDPR